MWIYMTYNCHRVEKRAAVYHIRKLLHNQRIQIEFAIAHEQNIFVHGRASMSSTRRFTDRSLFFCQLQLFIFRKVFWRPQFFKA